MGESETEFLHQLKLSLDCGISLVQYRQKKLAGADFERLARKVVSACHAAGANVLLNSSGDMAKQLGADGIQLNANQLLEIGQRPLPGSYWVAASCHNETELRRADELGLDFALLSPVQQTSTHPDARPLGWNKFSELVSDVSIPVYALGGVSSKDILQAWKCGGQGVSAIRALWGSYCS
jgi:8-oxo-dGTP diphosphatase